MANVPDDMNKVYKKWESKAASRLKDRFNSRSERTYNSSERGFPKRDNFRRSFSEEQSHHTRSRQRRSIPQRLPKDYGLAHFKMAPTILPITKQRPFTQLCCSKCLPQSRASLPHSYVQSLCICNLFLLPFVGKSTPLIPPSLRLFYFLFSRGPNIKYPDIEQKVLKSERVSSIIRTLYDDSAHSFFVSKQIRSSENNCSESTNQYEEKKMLQVMKTSINKVMLRISSCIAYKFLTSIMDRIQTHLGHIEFLKAIDKDEYPVIYVPLCRSHIDPVILSLILYMNNLKVPIFAVGESYPISSLSKILCYLGAFFVKPKVDEFSFQKEQLYDAVVESCIAEYLRAGHSFGAFIEGGRSRTGRPRIPQTGMLAVILNAFLEGAFEDAYIVPVSVNYEKLVDGSFVLEQLGKQKHSETFWSSVCSIWKVLHSNFGNVRADFCQPFSLKEFLQSNHHSVASLKAEPVAIETPPSSPSSNGSETSLYGHIATPSQLQTVVHQLGDHIIYDATAATSLMSTQLVSFLFLTKHRQGATLPQLLCSFNSLREELTKRKYDVGFTGQSSAVIKHALNLMGKDLIDTEAIELEWTTSDMENNNVTVFFYRPVVKLPYVLELQYYSNAAVPVFLMDSVVVNALYATLGHEICPFQLCESELFVRREELVQKALELCNMLSFEFVFVPPCGDLTSVINEVIQELTAKECLTVTGALSYSSGVTQKILSKRSHHFSFDGDDEDDEFSNYSEQYLRVDLSESSIDHLKFLRNVLSPCIESYWLSACTLLKLIYEVVEEKEFIREIQRTAEDRLHKGLLCYEESFGTETVRNSLKLFESWKVIEHYYEGKLKFLNLSENYESEEKVASVISRIGPYRQ